MRRKSLKVQVRRLVVDAPLSLGTDFTEELDGGDGVLPIRSLIIKKDGVGAIEDAGRNIAGLLVRRPLRLNH